MFTVYKCAQIISRQMLHKVNKMTSYYCFSAEADQFVNKARFLEKLKTNDTISELLYEGGRYIIFLKNELVCLNKDDKLVFTVYKDIKKWDKFINSKRIILDVLNESGSYICLFAVNLEILNESNVQEIENEANAKFVNVKHSLYFLSSRESQYVTQARSLLNFSRSVNFCCFCGSSLNPNDTGHRKQCTGCKVVHYPTLSPVGLTLIEDECHNEVLLIRQKRHPPGMYTCVAGFVEPGESFEENVKREVAEEVGLNIIKIEYCNSQPWAAPSCQLSLGCLATTKEKNFKIDPKEVEDAKWVTANDLKEAIVRTRNLKDLGKINTENLWAPPQNATSHYLMSVWLQRYHNFSLPSKP